MWNDGVAPETAIDFEYPYWSSNFALMLWLGGFAFFGAIYGTAVLADAPSLKPSAPRDLPESTKTTALGGHGHGIY